MFSSIYSICSIINVLTFPPVLMGIMVFLLGAALINRNKSIVIDAFIKTKEREY